MNWFADSTPASQREWDLVMERKMQKEREEDEHLHGDQPKYVTKAYKEHLVESNKWKAIEEEREKREAREDVRKRGDLTGFYRNLLTSNVAFGGEQAEATSSHELSADAKQRVLEKLTAHGRNVDVGDVASVIDSKENHTLEADPNAAPVQADWSKKLQEQHGANAVTEIEDTAEEARHSTEATEEDAEIARLKASLAAAKARKEREDAEQGQKRTADEAFASAEASGSLQSESKQQNQPAEPDLSARNKETAVNDAKARFLARKKAKEDAARAK